MEQSNRTTTVKPGASSGESAIALLTHAVEALRNHPQDAHAGLVAGRIVNYLKTFPTHAVVAYLVKGEDGKATLHRVALADWPEWAQGQGLTAESVTRRVEILDGLDFEPDERHAVADMANVGYSLMQALPAGYNWNITPAEIVGDLTNERDEALAALAAGEDKPERCESGQPDCGPVTNHDSEGVPLCATCWAELLEDPDQHGPAPVTESLFYLQDTRQYVGNCPMWWRPEGKGYTTRLDEAWKMTRAAAFGQQAARETDVPWPCEQIDALLRPTIDMQDLRGLKTGDPAP